MRKLLTSLLFTLWSSLAYAGVSCSLPFNLQNNTIADATQVMANYNALVTCLGNAASAGANTDITSLLGLTTPLGPTFGGTTAFIGGTSSGAANAQTITVTPNTFTLTSGYRVSFNAGFTNNSAMTLNVNGTGVTNVFRQSPFVGPIPLIGGEVVAGSRSTFEYDGVNWELLTNPAQYGGFSPLTNLASAATTDLGLVVSHNVQITGVTTITSFGSSASVTYPVFRITFAGAMVLTQNATSLILPGGINLTTAANDTAFALYLGGGNWQVIAYEKASGLPLVPTPVPGLIFGCGLSGGGSQTLTIAAGCQSTSDDFTTTMTQASTYTKTFANFVVGSGNGALDTGSIANNTWYHVFQIERLDSGVVDYLFSLSPTAPTFPPNYTKKRRLGSIRTDATPNIVTFSQNGDEFLWNVPFTDVNTTNPGTAAITSTLTVPTGLKVTALANWGLVAVAVGSSVVEFVSSLDQADTAPSTTVATFEVTATDIGAVPVQTRTNTSAQVRYRVSASNGGVTATALTMGWIDSRGKNP